MFVDSVFVQAVFVFAAIVALSNPSEGVVYKETGDCEVWAFVGVATYIRSFLLQATHENLYKYRAKEAYFGDEIDQTFEITIYFRVYCKSGINIICFYHFVWWWYILLLCSQLGFTDLRKLNCTTWILPKPKLEGTSWTRKSRRM